MSIILPRNEQLRLVTNSTLAEARSFFAKVAFDEDILELFDKRVSKKTGYTSRIIKSCRTRKTARAS